MDERWHKANEIVQSALELEPGRRTAFVLHICAGDTALHDEVVSLLTACENADQFLEKPVVRIEPEVAPAAARPVAPPPQRIGRYRILEPVGAGGMGEVYLAERDDAQYTQRVALKVVKRGMDTEEILRRFRDERQTLANLHHPNVARLIDGGATEDGRPYLVMEYVEGEPIDRYCDARRLGIEKRLELFRDVCAAVQDAHRNLVVHRDLKPGNVLVTADGVPKLLDFGIAKVLDAGALPTTLQTQTAMRALTPEYASPEQVRGQAIGTATDVYSLGVVLYELLTGRRPYELKNRSPGEMERVICEQTPRRPSAAVLGRGTGNGNRDGNIGDAPMVQRNVKRLRRRLCGDLDTIVLMALRKEPDRRYRSVEQLAEDIRRHLVSLPISARPDTFGYRAAKFVRRNRLGVSAAVLVFISLVVGMVATAWQRNEAISAQGLAETRRATAERAQREATQSLRDAYLAQARAGRSSNLPGCRFDSLEAIRKAAAIGPSLELRNEAIACMALSDVKIQNTFPNRPDASAIGMREPNTFAYAPRKGEISIVSTADGQELSHLKGSPLQVFGMIFSPDGRYLSVKYADYSLWVWDVMLDRHLLTVKVEGLDPDIAFSPNGAWMALLEADQRVCLYHLPSGEAWKSFPAGTGVFELCARPDGKMLAVASYEPPYLQVWDLHEVKVVVDLEVPTFVYRVDWSDDGRLLAAGCNDLSIYVWAVESGELKTRLVGHQGAPVHVYFHPDGNRLASWSWDNTSRLWDLETGHQFLSPIRDWAVMGFGGRFACRSGTSQLAVWRLEESREYCRLRAPELFRNSTLRIAPDGRLLVSAGANGVRLWDSGSGQELIQLSDQSATSAVFVHDGTRVVATVKEGLREWLLSRRGDEVAIEKSTLLLPQERTQGCCVSADGQTVIVCAPGELVVFDVTGRRVRQAWPAYAGMAGPAVSPDGRWAFTGIWKGAAAHVWDLQTGEVMQTFPGRHVRGRFSPDSRWLLVATGARFELYEVGTWNARRQFERESGGDLAGASAFSADGAVLGLTQSRYAIQLIEVATGEPLATLANPDQAAICDLCFSPDSVTLMAATTSRFIQVWDLRRVRRQLRDLGLDWHLPSQHDLSAGRPTPDSTFN